MKKNQMEAIKQLEAALLRIKRSGLVMVGIDDGLVATVKDEALKVDSRARSCVEVILDRANSDHPGTQAVNHYGAFLDSGMVSWSKSLGWHAFMFQWWAHQMNVLA